MIFLYDKKTAVDWLTKYVMPVFIGLLFTGNIAFAGTIFSMVFGQASAAPHQIKASVLDFGGDAIDVQDVQEVQAESLESLVPQEQGTFSISAKSAIVVEAGKEWGKVIFEKESDKELPIASLAKVMSALVAMESYSMADAIPISKSAMNEVGGQGNLKLGEMLSVKDLLYITLMESSNRAAKALSEKMGTANFVALMNQKADTLGLDRTHFADATGLDPATRSNAKDIAKLFSHLFEHYPLFREITALETHDLYLSNGRFHHQLLNTNKLLGEVAGVAGGKTGWTREAKGCLAVVQDDPAHSRYTVYIILGSEDRLSDMKQLIIAYSSK